MSNPFSNFLGGVMDGSGDLRDYQHASRLYVNNFYELAPKAGWIYYTVLNINPKLLTEDAIPRSSPFRAEFEAWYNRYKGSVGLLAKQVDLPKFSIQTEILNQYNRKAIIQKQITYSAIIISFHDDMANSTTNMWKNYYQYYIADTVSKKSVDSAKYQDTKYSDYLDPNNNLYGLSNGQLKNIPFFTSIDIYQLHKQQYTSFRLVNPIIKEWAHDQLDQTQGGRLLGSKMTVDYETVVYNTMANNKITRQNPGFTNDHYDNTPSPLRIGGKGNNSIFGAGGIINGAGEIFGELQNIDSASPLDLLNTAIKTGNLVRNASTVSAAGLKAEGYSILNSTLANISSTPASVVNLDGSVSKVATFDRISQGISGTVSGITQAVSPAGINLFKGSNSSVSGQTNATAKKLGG
jgi:hypothetical protein